MCDDTLRRSANLCTDMRVREYVRYWSKRSGFRSAAAGKHISFTLAFGQWCDSNSTGSLPLCWPSAICRIFVCVLRDGLSVKVNCRTCIDQYDLHDEPPLYPVLRLDVVDHAWFHAPCDVPPLLPTMPHREGARSFHSPTPDALRSYKTRRETLDPCGVSMQPGLRWDRADYDCALASMRHAPLSQGLLARFVCRVCSRASLKPRDAAI